MSHFDKATGRLIAAVGDAADDDVDTLRRAVVESVRELVADRMEELVGKAVAATMKAVREELKTFATLNLATKDDIVRLETLVFARGGDAALAAVTSATGGPPQRSAAVRTHVASTAKARRPRARQT